MSLLVSGTAFGEPSLQSLAEQVGSEDRKIMTDAISALASRTEPAALTILQALEADRLRVSPGAQILIEGEGGGLRDAISGKPVRAMSDLRKPLVTNSIRRSLRTAVARLELRSPNRDVRLHASEVIASAVEQDMAPAVRAALKAETDPEVHKSLALVLAQIGRASCRERV